MCTPPVAELDCNVANPTGSAVDEQTLTGLEMCRVEKPHPRGLATDVQGRGLLEGNAFGNPRDRGGGRHRELRVGAGAASEDPASDSEAGDSVAQRLDGACHI